MAGVVGVAGSSSSRAFLEALLRPYAQIILSRRLVSGALVLAAIATFPHAAAATLLAVVLAQATVLVLGFGRTAAREGEYACMAVLTALAAVMGPDGAPWTIVAAGAVLAVFVAAALKMLLSTYHLPPLSLPFVLSAWVVQAVARLVPSADSAGVAAALAWLPGSWLAPSVWDAPAAMLYVHGAAAGVLLLAAIGWHSRIALVLAAVGAAAAVVTRMALRSMVDLGPVDLTASFNAMLTAMALGGVFFVPHPSSIALALLGGVLASLITYALLPLSGLLSLPLLALPFALTTLLVVAALRLRERDRHPATAMFTASGPEDVLERHLMRVRRFGDFAWLPFRLPFRGTWTVTQGHEGTHTHRGPWRHAFDFEVIGADGLAYQSDGREPRDFRCYNLPVLAAGRGTVEQVQDGVPDNAVGGMNARENWGNSVTLSHGTNLYSVYAHLIPGSITVKPGDPVRAGAEIGRCGNSGRSLVPHLHFHVQRGVPLGSETIAADFGDVVQRQGSQVTVSHRVIPAAGAVVRPIVRDEAVADALAFVPGSRWWLRDDAVGRQEEARVEVDLWGRRVLRSEKGALYLESYESALVVVAFDGASDSLLRFMLLAMARVPFDQEREVHWTDRVPRHLLSAWPSVALDLLAMIAPGLNDWDVHYVARRTEGTLTIAGSAGAFRTMAVVSLGGGPHQLIVERAGATRVVTLAATSGPAPSPEVI